MVAEAMRPQAPPAAGKRRSKRSSLQGTGSAGKAGKMLEGTGTQGPAVPPPGHEKLNRQERKARFGVDCQDKVTWRSWKPGGEYAANIDVTNCLPKLQVIQYRLPQQKATFFLDFPEPITLSSGMKYSIKVRFRPTKLVPFHDALEIVTNAGSFFVEFEAVVPYASVAHPDKHDFGMCPVKVKTAYPFTLTNSGTLPVDYTWEVPLGQTGKTPPFTIFPKQGTLVPGQSVGTTITFFPEAASVFVAAAVCKYNGDSTSVFLVSGVGKYPYIRATTSLLEFGDVFIGQKEERRLVLKNQSPVPADFKITRKGKAEVGADPYTFHPPQGVIPVDGSLSIKVGYAPTSCGLYTLNDYTVSTVGGGDLTVSTSGIGIGPDITISTRHVHFGELDVSSTTQDNFQNKPSPGSGPASSNKPLPRKEKVVMLTNRSAHPCMYQMMEADIGAAFQIIPSQGTIGASKTVNVRIAFCPVEPANYYRRVYILAAGSVQALWVDLMGTAFHEKARPPPFTFKHVQQLRARTKVGLGQMTPEEMESLLNAIEGGSEPADSSEAAARDALKLAIDPPSCTERAALLDVFKGPLDPTGTPFTLDEGTLDFGVVKSLGSESQSVCVVNHTSSKATALWVLPPGSHFTVDPVSQDVPAFGSAAFRIRAQPATSSSHRQSVLECYAFFKTMRSFRLVTDACIAPPTCLHLACSSRGEGRLCPVKAALSSSRVEFPPIHIGDTVFQTVSIFNQSDTPCQYAIQLGPESSSARDAERAKADNTSELMYMQPGQETAPAASFSSDNEASSERLFDIFPRQGVIPAAQHQILLLKFKGQEATSYRCTAEVLLDNSSYRSLQIQMVASAYAPQLMLRNDATIYFRSTFVNNTTTRSYTIENLSRIDVAFRWDVPQRMQNIISVEPQSGVLRGNEKKAIKFQFTPQKIQKYILSIPVACMSTNDLHDSAVQQSVTVIGEGTTGALTLEPFDMCIETVLAGESAVREVTLFNSTTCDTAYGLGWVAEPDSLPIDPDEVSINGENGTIAVRSHKTVTVTFKPKRRGLYSFRLYCKTLMDDKYHQAWSSTKEKPPTAEELALLPTCGVIARGGYPVLEITDVRCRTISKAHLWVQASVAEINQALDLDVDKHDTDTKEFDFKEICKKHQHLDIAFGSAVVNSQSTKLLMTWENVSEIPVDFSFIMSCDSEVPVERWFHEEPPTNADIDQENILDNNLFSIDPPRGSIPPHESITLTFTYNRRLAGVHELPVLLKVRKGKRIVLNLKGTTLQENEKHLDILSPVHTFAPVAIGDANPPMQYCELRNASHVPVNYDLAPEPFAHVCEQAYDFPVFQCLNSYGEVPPQSSLMLQWYFRPLEAREYRMKLPITVLDGPTYEIEFVGTGYNPLQISEGEKAELEAREFREIGVFPTLGPSELFPVVLSQDVLEFGRISVHSLHRRILLLKNTHASDAFTFSWATDLQHGEQILEMTPQSGLIEPGSHVMCRLTLYSGSLCHIVEQSIQCKVVNEDLRLRRQAARDEVGREAAMALEPEEDMQSTQHNGKAGSGTAISTSVTGTTGLGPRRGKGRPKRVPVAQLPPRLQTAAQLQQTIDKLREETCPENIDENSDELIWLDPPATYLDVRLMAHVLGLEAFKKLDPDAWSKQFLPTITVYQEHVDPPVPPPPATLRELQRQESAASVQPVATPASAGAGEDPPSSSELMFAMGHLAELLLEVVHSPEVEQAYLDLDETPIRYFEDFSKPGTGSEASEVRRMFTSGQEVSVLQGAEEVQGTVVGHARGRVGVKTDDGATIGALPRDVMDAELLKATMEQRQREYEAAQTRSLLQDGQFQCMLEEIFEALIFDIIKDASANSADEECSLVPPRQNRLRLPKRSNPTPGPQPSPKHAA